VAYSAHQIKEHKMARTRNIGPGFVADASLTRSTRPYRAAAGSVGDGGVVPQIRAGGFGTVGGLGGILTDFGCYMNYAFCIAGCVWSWAGDQKFGGPIADSLGQLCVAQCDVDLVRCQGGLPPDGGIP
jgi:hypothetical protein